MLFETDGPQVHPEHRQASGNPVRIGDGCATVTGYKLPQPLVSEGAGKAGARFQARSQDIGLAMLVMAFKAGQATRPSGVGADFSVQEKDEARPVRECAPGFQECLHSPIWRGLDAFAFQALRWSLNREPAPRTPRRI
jgi:hypothetical protein